MILSRNSFFIFLFILVVGPLLFHKLIWLAGSKETTGTMYFVGHGNFGSILGISTYPVIWFMNGKDTVVFNGNVNIPLKPGERVSVRYQRRDPRDAKVNNFSCIWGDTLAYDFAPLLFFLVIYFHPDLIPKRSKLILGRKPWVKIV